MSINMTCIFSKNNFSAVLGRVNGIVADRRCIPTIFIAPVHQFQFDRTDVSRDAARSRKLGYPSIALVRVL